MTLPHEEQKLWRVSWYWARGADPIDFKYCETKFCVEGAEWRQQLAWMREQEHGRAWSVYVEELVLSYGWVQVHAEEHPGDPNMLIL